MDGQLEIPILDAGDGYLSYLWHDGSTNQTIEMTGPGTYAVTVVNESGCFATSEYVITEFEASQDFYLVFYVVKDNAKIYSFICPENNPDEISIEDKAAVEEIIKENYNFEEDGIVSEDPLWICLAENSGEIPIDKNANNGDDTNTNLRLYPIVILEEANGTLRKVDQYTKSNWEELSQADWYADYEFQLIASSITSEINITQQKFFPIDFSMLPDEVSVALSLKKEIIDENAPIVYSPVATMDIKFQPPPDETVYLLYYNEEPAPDEITIEEKTNISFQLKRLMEDGSVEDLNLNDEDISDITWDINAEVILDENGMNTIEYLVPDYTDPDQEIVLTAKVNYSNLLSVVIKPQPKPITSGYNPVSNTPLPEPHVTTDKTPVDYVLEALNRIENQDEEMHDNIINGRQIDIVLASSQNPAFDWVAPGDIVFGHSSFDLDGDNRIFIDPETIEIYSTEPNYTTCPTDIMDIPILLTITGDEYDEIRSAIVDVTNEQVPVPHALLEKIGALYPELVEDLEEWCMISQENESNYAEGQLEMLFNTKKLAYYSYPPTASHLAQFIAKSDL